MGTQINLLVCQHPKWVTCLPVTTDHVLKMKEMGVFRDVAGAILKDENNSVTINDHTYDHLPTFVMQCF